MQDGAILVGDAGGTNVRFALAHETARRITVSPIWKRPGADFKTFEDAAAAFLSEARPKLVGASFGFAGAVAHGHVDLLHRGWSVEFEKVRQLLGISRLVAVNDFFAMARSAPDLPPDEVQDIAPGKADPDGSIVVGGPGTGFGIGILRRIMGADGYVVVGGEGGHQAFAPQTDIEWRLAEALRAKLGYVSNEIVAAGAGFEDTIEALAGVLGVPFRKRSEPEVFDAAQAGERLAVELFRIRAATVMTAMGDMALAANATGGVFLAGGISVRLAPWLKEKAAIDRLRNRGWRSELVAPIPVKLIVSETAPLIGSARLWLDQAARGWL